MIRYDDDMTIFFIISIKVYDVHIVNRSLLEYRRKNKNTILKYYEIKKYH